MKCLILAVFCLASVISAQNTTRRAVQPHADQEEAKLRDEFVRLTSDYKKSLGDLLPYQEREVQRAEEKLTKLRELRKENLVEQRDVDAAEKTLADARAKIAETRQQMKVADAQIAAALTGSQVPAARTQGSSTSPLRNTPGDVERDAGGVQAIIDQSESHYKLAETSLKDHNGDVARAEFDKAIDTVLDSGMDVRANPKLQTYYLQLVERIFHLESSLKQTTAQDVLAPGTAKQTQPSGLLREQKFEPSPLDDLSKLVLTEEENTVTGDARTGAPNCPETVTVRAKAGETISQIASRYGADAEEVARLNAYAADAALVANQMVKVPAGSGNAEGGTMRKIALRGFRLGMPAAEVKRSLPFLSIKATNAYGRSTALTIIRGRQPVPPELKGVGVIAFAFQDGKVSAISISYDDAIKWGSLGEFAARTSEALELPKGWTRFEVGGEPRMYLSCGDVWLTAEFVNPYRMSTPLLRLWDDAASRTYKQRVAAAAEKRRLEEEKKKRAFKP